MARLLLLRSSSVNNDWTHRAWHRKSHSSKYRHSPTNSKQNSRSYGTGNLLSASKDARWKTTVQKVCSEAETNVHQAHKQTMLDGAAAFVMATLDQELFLDDDQVQGLHSLVEQTDPHHNSTRRKEPSSYQPLKTDNAMAPDLGFPGAATVTERVARIKIGLP